MADRKTPSLLGLALDLLIRSTGWTAKELAEKDGVAPSTISAYLAGDSLTQERLEELAVGRMDLSPERIERAILAARLVLPPPPLPWSPVNPTDEQLRSIEKAVATAGVEVMELVREVGIRETREENRLLALEEGRELAAKLKTYSAADQEELVEGLPDYQHWGLSYVLTTDSEAAAADRPRESLKLAELALLVAAHTPGTETFRSRLRAWAIGFIASAQRVGNHLRKAEEAFARTWRLWKEGDDDAGLLSEAYLLDLEASLRRAQRQFPRALRLHADALEKARPEEVGIILLNKGFTLKEKGDHEDSLEVLEQAAQLVNGEQQPRLRWVLRFNQTATLLRLGRAEDAALILPEVRRLAEDLRNDLDFLRTVWLDAICNAGLGRRDKALPKLQQIREKLNFRQLPFDYALASLDLALLLREEERFPEIQILANEMIEIFTAQGVGREAVAAVILFKEAAEREQVTVELVRRLQDYLASAKNMPNLPFELQLPGVQPP